jgi:manganese/iron transport system permease protein
MLITWQIAALLSGGTTGLLGTYLVGLRMPFLAVGIAHAAMAGAIFGHLLGWPPMLVSLGAALAAGQGLAWLVTMPIRADLGVLSSILLSFTMGLAFLGIGLNQGDMTPHLSLLWGSLLFTRPRDLALMTAAALALGVFLLGCRRPLEAILFSPTLARAAGVRDRLILSVFMLLAAVIITLNLQTVGGLMIYSLLTNPAAAAYELATTMRAARLLAVALGIVSTLCGFWASYLLNWPTGACIVLVSTALYAVAVCIARRRAHGGAHANRSPTSWQQPN